MPFFYDSGPFTINFTVTNTQLRLVSYRILTSSNSTIVPATATWESDATGFTWFSNNQAQLNSLDRGTQIENSTSTTDNVAFPDPTATETTGILAVKSFSAAITPALADFQGDLYILAKVRTRRNDLALKDITYGYGPTAELTINDGTYAPNFWDDAGLVVQERTAVHNATGNFSATFNTVTGTDHFETIPLANADVGQVLFKFPAGSQDQDALDEIVSVALEIKI